MKITEEMTIKLNEELKVMNVPFRFKYANRTGNPHIEITLPSMNYVDTFIINPTKEFYDWLKIWFKTNENIELDSNNTGSIMWSTTGWDD